MTTKGGVSNGTADDGADAGPETLHSGGEQAITPAQRWMLICENVYARAQKRGFVGGDPLQDLVEAEQEVDAANETDFESVLSLNSTAEITEQLKALFACYGFDQEHLDSLLDGHQEGLEQLAAMNRESLDITSWLAAKQTKVLEGVASEAVKTLQSFTAGRLRPEGVFNIAKLSMQALDNTLAGFQRLTQPATSSRNQPKQALGRELLQDAIASAYKGRSAKELSAAPVTALEGVSDSVGKGLQEHFAMGTICDMANHPHVEWASGIVLLADAGGVAESRSSREGDPRPTAHAAHRNAPKSIVDAPLSEIHEISQGQAKLLEEAFGIATVRDLASNRYFGVARAIVMLAESEG